MKRLIVRNRVKDFDPWKAIFDEGSAATSETGLELDKLWRCCDDPNGVFFILTVADRDKAQAFLESPTSAEAGQRSGVLDGELWFVE